MKLAFSASQTPLAQVAKIELQKRYGGVELAAADCVVALGGDGQVLRTLYGTMFHKQSVYAMRRTESVGFLCNLYKVDDLIERIHKAHKVNLHPLRTECIGANGTHTNTVSINEVTLIRESPQCAKLRISVDGVVRIEQFSGDGLLVSTPAGSTAYNHSAGGPIMPLDANMLIMNGICGFRPRRWSYAVLSQDAVTEIDVLEHEKRPVRVEAGLGSTNNIVHSKIWLDRTTEFRLLFDPDQHLHERIMQEQFSN
ncbi:MAG: NAD kinase [Alphaproteobacteria bacterium]|nr:NAD kinase [Alphaproteobacteria bacterium]